VTWERVDVPSPEQATNIPHPFVDFASRTEGVVVNFDGRWGSIEGKNVLYLTTDGGETWEQIFPEMTPTATP
jgi:photosystem II stability/assembly factor-like uncharacterized protein